MRGKRGLDPLCQPATIAYGDHIENQIDQFQYGLVSGIIPVNE